jgi:hypothetical protein
MFHVKAKRGGSIKSLSAIAMEEEIILLPGSAFTINSILEVAPKLWIVELVEVILLISIIS